MRRDVAEGDGDGGSTQAAAPAAGPGGIVTVAGIDFVGDTAGALFWAEERLLLVADLHLEKGSSFARRGMMLPPYDTAATLARLGAVIAHHAPRTVVALGDSFHDGHGPSRLTAQDQAVLAALQRGRDWIWITGNHDPEPSAAVGGMFADCLAIGPLTFRHLPTGGDGEIAGHLHPVARVSVRGRAIRRRCFAGDGRALVMPAFGAYAGGLNVRHAAFAAAFVNGFTAHMLGARRLYAFAARHCLPD